MRPTRARIRSAAFAVGLMLAVGVAVGHRIPAAPAAAGVSLNLYANLTGELDVSPVGRILHAPALAAAGRSATAHSRVTIRNQTGAVLAVRLRALPSTADLDDVVWMSATTGARRLRSARLADWRRWSREALRLAPGQRRTLELAAWADRRSPRGYAGLLDDVTLQWDSRVIDQEAQ